MQVILLEDVSNVGKKYETHEVANGYGTNYLIPRGLARVANEANIANLKKKREAAEQKRKEEKEARAQKLADIDGETVTITAKANDQGGLFAGITPAVIAEAVSDQTGVEIEASAIQRENAIDMVGSYDIAVKILESSAQLKLEVAGE